MTSSEGRELGPQLLALAVFVITLWAQSPEAYAGITDDGLYLVLAKAIARGDGLHFIHLPGAPPAAFFPPLLPAVAGFIGMIFPAFPANLLLVQIINAAALGGAAWLACGLVRSPGMSNRLALAAVALGFLNVAVVSTTVRSFPEPLLLFWWFATMAAVQRTERHPRWGLVAGGLAAAAVLTASVGWALLIGAVMALVARRDPRVAAAAAGAALVVLAPWLVWSLMVGRDPLVSASIDSALVTVSPSLADLTRLIQPAGGGLFGALATALALPLAVLGGWRVWRTAPAWIIAVGAHTVLLVVLPTSHRSVWVLIPSFVAWATVGGVWIWTTYVHARRFVIAAASVMVAAVVVLNGAAFAQRRFIPATTPEAQETSRLFIAGVGTETPATAVIVTDASALLHLYANRTTVPLPSTSGGEAAGPSRFCAHNADYVAIAGLHGVDASRFAPPMFLRIFAITDGPALFRLECDP